MTHAALLALRPTRLRLCLCLCLCVCYAVRV